MPVVFWLLGISNSQAQPRAVEDPGKNKLPIHSEDFMRYTRRKGSFHHRGNWERDERSLWGHRVSSNHQSLVLGSTYFGNYHTSKHLQDHNLSARIWNGAWNTNRLMIILIIYLVRIKSLVWGWKASFRLRANRELWHGVTDIWCCPMHRTRVSEPCKNSDKMSQGWRQLLHPLGRPH